MLALGFERQGRRFGFGANTQYASRAFMQLGLSPTELAPRRVSQASVSLALNAYGTIGGSYTSRASYDRPDERVLGANYSVTVGKLGFLGFSVLRVLGEQPTTLVGLTFTASLDERTSASSTFTGQQGANQGMLQVQRNLPAGTGMGYRFLAGTGASDRREAGLSAQNGAGTYLLEAAQSGGEGGLRASASGGIALLDGQAYLSRRINDSFAVVRVPDYPNVRVYADNQHVATTGADGTALLPRLRAYERNAVRIEQADVPLDSEVGELQAPAVPYYRSGVLLDFQVKRSRGALLSIVLDGGRALPAGAVVLVNADRTEFPVGMRGEVYLTGLASTNKIRVSWRGQECEFRVAYPDSSDPLPHLGTYRCSGVKP
jgi:outer membrane usher protein